MFQDSTLLAFWLISAVFSERTNRIDYTLVWGIAITHKNRWIFRDSQNLFWKVGKISFFLSEMLPPLQFGESPKKFQFWQKNVFLTFALFRYFLQKALMPRFVQNNKNHLIEMPTPDFAYFLHKYPRRNSCQSGKNTQIHQPIRIHKYTITQIPSSHQQSILAKIHKGTITQIPSTQQKSIRAKKTQLQNYSHCNISIFLKI